MVCAWSLMLTAQAPLVAKDKHWQPMVVLILPSVTESYLGQPRSKDLVPAQGAALLLGL